MALRDFLNKWLDRGNQKEATIPLFSKLATMMSRSFSFVQGKDPTEYYNGWIFACVRAIAEEVSQIDLRLYRYDSKGNKELVTEHAAIDSIRTVNDYFTKHELFERLQSNLELDGNEYWFVQPAKVKGLFELYPLIPKYISPVLSVHNYVASYSYIVDGVAMNLNSSQVIHFRNFNPKSDVLGKSTLSAVKDAADTDDGAKAFNKAYFKNNALPSVVLEYPQALTPDQIQVLKTSWQEEYAGAQNGYKTAVASDGLKVTTLETSHSDMEFIEQRRFSRDEILAIFRVPKIIVGIMEDVNRASAEAAMYAFMQWTILPKMRRIVDTLNEFYLPLFGDKTLRFEFANKAPEDRDQLVNFFNAGINNGYLSPNDVRRMLGLPELVDGEKLYLPYSLMEYSSPLAKSIAVSGGDTVQKAVEKATKSIVDIFAKKKKEIDLDKQKEVFEKRGEAKSRAEQRRRIGQEKLYAKTAKELFDDQKERAIDGLKEYLDQKSWKANLKAKSIPLLDKDAELKITIDLFSPIVALVYKEEGQAGLEQLGLDEEFDIDTPDIKAKIKKNTALLSESMTNTTIETLNKDIIEGLEAGEAIAGLTARISESTGFDKARSEAIARTETVRSGAQAEVAAWEESGVVASLVWWTAQDERVDDECAELHGNEVDIGESFISPGELQDLGEDDYTGVGIDTPPRHPNCRCTIIPMLKEKTARPIRKFYQKETIG